jgi:hypothetical protein
MTRRYCDTGRTECPHLPECKWECHFDNAGLEPTMRKIDDIDPVSDQWHTMGRFFIGAVFAAITVFFALVFFTGVYVWSLLI